MHLKQERETIDLCAAACVDLDPRETVITHMMASVEDEQIPEDFTKSLLADLKNSGLVEILEMARFGDDPQSIQVRLWEAARTLNLCLPWAEAMTCVVPTCVWHRFGFR